MNLYGDVMGSTYRGRVFYNIIKYGKADPITKVFKLSFKFPKNPYPNSPTKTYLLRVDIFEGVEMPPRNKGTIHILCGPYIMQT